MQLEKISNDIDTNKALQILCGRNFYEYCVYIAPDFYTADRTHLKLLCNTLQSFYEDKLLKPTGQPYTNMAISIPPRLGKSRTLELLSTWVFGKDQNEKIMTVSYNETLSISFSKSVRDKIQTQSLDNKLPTVNSVFPELKIKHGSGSAQLWALAGQHLSYLGGSPTGTLTGIGATLCIVDDLIKNDVEAMNDRVLDEHYNFFTNTLRQRLEEGHKKIVNFTRWATKDLIGRILDENPDDWYVLTMEAMKDGEMLCPSLLSMDSYLDIKSNMSKAIFNANYHQEPIDIKNRLYTNLKTYSQLPMGKRFNYTDTADEGNCYLCSINYVLRNREAYITDVLYTKENMEVTEPATAEMLKNDRINVANIESNNGGKGFARAVRKHMSEKLKSNITTIKWFHQSGNKIARIKTHSNWVCEHIYFPVGWEDRWPEFHKHVTTFNPDGKGQMFDAPDTLTGIAEMSTKPGLDFI